MSLAQGSLPAAADAARGRADPVSLQSLALLGILGLLGCTLLRDLRIGGPHDVWQQLSHPNVFMLGAFGVAVWRALRSRAGQSAATADLCLLALIALAAVPLAAESSLAGIGLCVGALGGWLFARSPDDQQLRAAAVCLLALGGNLSIAPLVFRLTYQAFIGLDMALIQMAVDLSGAPVTATPAGLVAADGTRVMLVGACSSFNGVSAAMLVHMTWAMAIRTEVSWRDGIAVLATVCLATLLNVVRLTLTASGGDAYAFWHGAVGETPLGGEVFWVAHHGILLAGAWLSAHWAGRPDPAGTGRR